MYAFPILSRFDNNTFTIIRNAALMSIRHFPQTVPLLFIFGIMALIGWFLMPVSIFFIFGAWAVSYTHLEEYLDGVNLSHREFYEKLIENEELPTTSQVAPYAFEDVYKKEMCIRDRKSTFSALLHLKFIKRVSLTPDAPVPVMMLFPAL